MGNATDYSYSSNNAKSGSASSGWVEGPVTRHVPAATGYSQSTNRPQTGIIAGLPSWVLAECVLQFFLFFKCSKWARGICYLSNIGTST